METPLPHQVLQRAGPDARREGQHERTILLQERGDRRQGSAGILRLHRYDDEVRRRYGVEVVRSRLDAEILRQRFAGRSECLAHSDLLALDAAPEQATDERPAHVAAAENRELFILHGDVDCTESVSALRARAEQGRADSHQGRALEHGRFEVRSSCPSRAYRARARCGSRPKQLAQLREPVALASRVFLRRRQAMSPRSFSRGSCAIAAASAATSCGAAPPLDASPARFTWMQTLSGAASCGRCAERRSAIRSRSTPWTQSKCSARARVLLAWTCPMKCQTRPRSRNSCILVDCLLQIVFAEVPHPQGRRRPQGPGRLRLARCQECDRVDISSRLDGGRGDALAHPPQVFRQILRTY